MFYKIIDNNNIIGVATEDNFRKFQRKHNIVIYSDVRQSQFIEYNYKYYRDTWLLPINTDAITCSLVSIIKIEEDEYNALLDALKTQGEIEIEKIEDNLIPPVEPEPVSINNNDTITIDFIKKQKINQMSKECHDTITNGVNVLLSDGKNHHFSLEVEDQLKIQALALKAQNGVQSLPWHEDNNYCVFYSAEDIMKLYQAMEDLQLFHTTYFNSLKMYIKSLETIEEINNITYGINIPVEYQSEVLQYLYSQSEHTS